MKIACWNVNSVRTRLPHVLRWLKDAAVDVLLLQELKCTNDHFPGEAFEEMGYNLAVWGQKTYNGVAILSKYPIEDITRGFDHMPNPDEARYIGAFTGGLHVASVYVPNGSEVDSPKFAYKMAFFQGLYDHLQRTLRGAEPFVLGGDFNVAPEADDVYDPRLLEKDRLLTSLNERRAFRALLGLGYRDALKTIHPKGSDLFTWWDYRAGSFPRNHGFRIDHFLLSPSVADRLQTTHVDAVPRGWDKPSDHAPLWITLG